MDLREAFSELKFNMLLHPFHVKCLSFLTHKMRHSRIFCERMDKKKRRSHVNASDLPYPSRQLHVQS